MRSRWGPAGRGPQARFGSGSSIFRSSTSDCVRACRSLETEQTRRMKAELESAEYKQKLQVVTCKYGQVQKELQVRGRVEVVWRSCGRPPFELLSRRT